MSNRPLTADDLRWLAARRPAPQGRFNAGQKLNAALTAAFTVLFLVTVVPASLNGIGLREATFVVVLAGAGVSREDAFALGLAYFAVGVITGALGGLALLRRSLLPGHGRTGGSRPVT